LAGTEIRFNEFCRCGGVHQVHSVQIKAGEGLVCWEIKKLLHCNVLLLTDVGGIILDTCSKNLAQIFELDWVRKPRELFFEGHQLFLGTVNIDRVIEDLHCHWDHCRLVLARLYVSIFEIRIVKVSCFVRLSVCAQKLNDLFNLGAVNAFSHAEHLR